MASLAELLTTETRAVVSEDARVLQNIEEQGCNLAIWQRSLPFNPIPLISSQPLSIRFIVPADDPVPFLTKALQEAGFTPSDALNGLVKDIRHLCALFHPIADTPNISVRLEIVTNNACRKFHGDYVSARLITTYTGPGTQWIDQADIARVDDGLEPLAINQMAAGDVGIFKGKLSTNRPAIHRSPPIEGSGAARLVVVLNPEPKQENNR
ncbi:MAG: DUF1826 domain-containing protein [Pseudomonadota bacterium]